MRLTKNYNKQYGYELKCDNPNTSINQDTSNAIQKLGQLEDIEEEFQIDNFDDLIERLKTYKFLANHEMSCVDVEGYNCMLKDLKEYQDIEEELGIDLITLFKALKDGIYYRNLIGGICRVPKIDLSYYSKYSNKPEVLCLVEREDDYDEQIIAHYLFKDYGKTWALTKEELTDGK